ncbi:MAG: metallophosphoesterase family protein, partial [Candidatus Methylomirabilis sp.]|nr:metallophosphoesterase family protein [Deltaproteobacteria bacterium]
MTVSADAVALTWVTDAPGTTEVELGDAPFRYDEHFVLEDAHDRFHYATLEGLEPGRTYSYRVGSSDASGTAWSLPSINNPGVFTTLTPPPGEKLFSFATLNDTHVGETTAGLIVVAGVVLTPGFTIDDLETPDPGNPYWRFTNEDAVRRLNDRPEVAFTIIKGDLTSEQTPEEFEEAKRIFDGLRRPYYVLRGNHDRKGGNAGDPFLEVFDLPRSYYSFDREGHHFVLLDSVDPPTGFGVLPEAQRDWMEADLAANPRKPTFIYAHHPLAPATEAGYRIPITESVDFVRRIAAFPEVLGVFSGHTHRNALYFDPATGPMRFVETAATKEYPGGYALYDVYKTGYVQTFWKLPCTLCREWSEITKQEYFGLAPILQMGEVFERNFTHLYPDGDADGEPDATDNCRADANAGQLDSDGDGLGDVCDPTPLPPAPPRRRSSGGCATSEGGGSPFAFAAPFALLLA